MTTNYLTEATLTARQNSFPTSSPFPFAPAAARILLWDIDGTLLRSTQMDSFKLYMIPVVRRIFGTIGRLPEMRVSGMTDLQIVLEALEPEGFTMDAIRARLNEFRRDLFDAMEHYTTRTSTPESEPFFYALPGVFETLEAVAATTRFRSTLLTGNLEPSAYLKIRLVGLEDFFQLPGAFGEDSFDRRELPAIAAARIEQHFGLRFQPSQFIVIGDTPNDIYCAQHFGTRVVAVGTGRNVSQNELQVLKPDAFLSDLSNTKLVLETLANL